ncbi:MAG: type 1 glutamine amidotransferase [Candidatus Omnitrophica bacterium]|nr:type 1 glutamine amidotransferase [Candidatus Omnitrophota bacterium]
MPKEIIILKHIEIEGPGSIEEFFRNTVWPLKTIDLWLGKDLPEKFDNIAAVISLGGPMNVYEEERYPFLKSENDFLQRAIKEEIPILGICLGAQLLAKACKAKVKKLGQKEIGWYEINLTSEGKNDLLFEGLSCDLEAFQWHEDTFERPTGSIFLAESAICANQAFRFGSNAYGLQFHVEVTPAMIETWMNHYAKDSSLSGAKEMLIEAYKKEEALKKTANLIYLNFARIIKAS